MTSGPRATRIGTSRGRDAGASSGGCSRCLKLALFLAPMALFAASYLVTDCGSRAGAGLGQLFKAGACARGEILNGALSLPTDLAALRRAMN